MLTDDSDHPQTTNLNLDHQSRSSPGCELETDPLMTSSPKTKLPKGSAQLNRWSRARTLRSGRRFELLVQKKDEQNRTSSSPLSPQRTGVTTVSEEEEEEMGTLDEEEKVEQIAKEVEGKVIYMVSDGTGWTLEHAVNAALGQFEYLLLHRKRAVSTRLFSGIETVDGLLDVIKQAAKEGALLLYTLVDPTMAEPAKHACRLWGVPSVDILRPTTEAIASHLGVEPSGIPRSERKMPLTEEYFRRIEAIEFTIKQDDGALPQNLNQADILLVGVSRSGKTPLSIYLAQKGYKVANVPLVSGIELPKTLFEVDQENVFALSINPVILQNIRKARAKTLGLNRDMQCTYSEMDHVRKELEFATRIYARNPLWPVIDVTGKAIEETAAVILRIYHDRKQKFSMPSISRQY